MVLLLDQDDDFRSALAANLTDDGHVVCHYACSADLPPLASLQGLTMVILDYQLSGENSLSFADRFHATHPNVPMIMLTTYKSHFLESELAERTFITLRRKPVDYEDLARLLPVTTP